MSLPLQPRIEWKGIVLGTLRPDQIEYLNRTTFGLEVLCMQPANAADLEKQLGQFRRDQILFVIALGNSTPYKPVLAEWVSSYKEGYPAFTAATTIDGFKDSPDPEALRDVRRMLSPSYVLLQSSDQLPPNEIVAVGSTWITVDGVPNFRDFGILNPRIGRGKLFRSFSPKHLTSKGFLDMLAHGIRGEIDLTGYKLRRQSYANTPRYHSTVNRFSARPLPNHLNTIEQIIEAFQDRGGESGPQLMIQGILSRYARTFGAAVTWLAKQDRACVIHCNIGKDRTGILVALLLKLFDTPHEVIAFDYELSNWGLSKYRDEKLAALTPAHAVAFQNVLMAGYFEMLRALDYIESVRGGARQFLLRECRVDEAVLDRLIARLSSE